jgi:predicted DNA-binding helix-hairpin-helix protein
MREHRLYQVDFLLRSYGFSLDEIHFDGAGALPLDADPKTLWASHHPERFPVEINKARLEELLRVPGIGPRSAQRLLRMRRQQRLRDVEALRAAGASWKVASPYLLLDGRPAERQLRLC